MEIEKDVVQKNTYIPGGRKMEPAARLIYVRQFFPNLSESPGSTTKLNDSASGRKANTQIMLPSKKLNCDGLEQISGRWDGEK